MGWYLLPLPYPALGYSWKSISGSWREEGQAARPGPADPMQDVGAILALRAMVHAKIQRWHGWGPGLKADKHFAVNTVGKGDYTVALTTHGDNCRPAAWSRVAKGPPSFLPAGCRWAAMKKIFGRGRWHCWCPPG